MKETCLRLFLNMVWGINIKRMYSATVRVLKHGPKLFDIVPH